MACAVEEKESLRKARKSVSNRRYRANPEKRAAMAVWLKEYRSRPEIREKIRARERGYLAKNRERIYAARKLHEQRNPEVRIKHNLRCRLRDALKEAQGKNRRGGVSAVRDLGCSIHFFMDYIAAKFQDGMSWENWGRWHLDHIKPLCDFDLTVREQVLEACHYTNMQPLWAKDNLTKNRWTSPALTDGGA